MSAEQDANGYLEDVGDALSEPEAPRAVWVAWKLTSAIVSALLDIANTIREAGGRA